MSIYVYICVYIVTMFVYQTLENYFKGVVSGKWQEVASYIAGGLKLQYFQLLKALKMPSGLLYEFYCEYKLKHNMFKKVEFSVHEKTVLRPPL